MLRTEQKSLFAVPFTKYLCVHPNAEGGIPMMSPRMVSSRRTRSDLVALSLAVNEEVRVAAQSVDRNRS